MNKTYLVRLKPLDSYFFSGRETFNYSNGKKITDENKVNYYVKSEYFPQQTTLLGVIRKEILIKKELYKENRKDYSKDYEEVVNIVDNIGNGSFTVCENSLNKEGFGKIKSISPVFLYRNGSLFTTSPLDYGLKFSKEKNKNKNSCFDNDIKKFIPELSEYKAKEGLNKKIISFNPHEIVYNYEDVFKKDERVGIKVKSVEKGFYRQLNYKLKDNFEFCFFIELSEEIFDSKELDSIVYVGGEGRPFRLKIKEDKRLVVGNIININNKNDTNKRIVCIGDVLLKGNEYKRLKKYSDFILGEVSFFKNFVYDYNNKKNSEKKVSPYLLLKRGSVIYCDGKDNQKEIKKIIDNKIRKVIGYNYITGGEE